MVGKSRSEKDPRIIHLFGNHGVMIQDRRTGINTFHRKGTETYDRLLEEARKEVASLNPPRSSYRDPFSRSSYAEFIPSVRHFFMHIFFYFLNSCSPTGFDGIWSR